MVALLPLPVLKLLELWQRSFTLLLHDKCDPVVDHAYEDDEECRFGQRLELPNLIIKF